MKKMCLRKTVCFLLVLSMIAVLAGCGGGDPTASGSGTDAGRGISQSMCLLPGEEQTIYTVGGKGIHRHVIGGNMMEQVVDGSLSMLGNPNYAINSAIRLEGDAFLALFSNGRPSQATSPFIRMCSCPMRSE